MSDLTILYRLSDADQLDLLYHMEAHELLEIIEPEDYEARCELLQCDDQELIEAARDVGLLDESGYAQGHYAHARDLGLYDTAIDYLELFDVDADE